MRPLGTVLEDLHLRKGHSAPDPASAEEIERWLVERQLWPTSRIQADLAAALLELDRFQDQSARAQQSAVAGLRRDLELAQVRDRLQAERPQGCWCFGIGGHGRVFVPVPVGDPLPHWRVWCSCPDALAIRQRFEEQRAAAALARRQATMERLWGSLPARYAEWTLSTLAECSDAHQRLAHRIEAWLDDGIRWLYLHGLVARGKTGAAVSALRALAERGHTALFVDTTQLLDRLRSGYADMAAFAESRDALWESLFGVEVLLIDDIGAERHRRNESVDWAAEKLWQLIGYRHREQRRTILTSNLSIDELGDHLGHTRIPSRIQEAALVLDCSRLPNLRVSK